jgi:hypothetical protein
MTSEPQTLTLPETLREVSIPVCPTCDQPIAKEEIERVSQKIEMQARVHSQELENLREQERAAAEKEIATRLEVVEKEKASALVLARQEGAAQVTAVFTPKLYEAEERYTNSQAELERLLNSREKDLSTVRQEAAAAAREAADAQIAEAESKQLAAELAVAQLKESQEEQLGRRLSEQREALEEDKEKAVNAAHAAAFLDKQKIEERLAAMKRELDRQSANELGEGAEVDLFESLKQEFSEDTIARVKSGLAGADIVHEIVSNGTSCGSIVYDSKNRKQWRNSYTEKLRNDQIAAKADHAILTSHKFPAGRQQLYTQDGVIVVNPARAVAMASILRRHVIQVHSLQLSTEARDEKMITLYEYINSDQFRNQLEKIDELTNDLLELDVKEEKAHQTTWSRRGALIKSVERAYGNFVNDIDRIVSRAHPDEEAAQ